MTDEQRTKLQEDPAIKKIDGAFESEVNAAEVAYANAKRKAKEKRLASYRDRLKAFTKAGEFDKAVACKQVLTAMENDEDTKPARPASVPADAISHKGSWYWFSNHKANFADAHKQATAMKGKLAYIESAAENDFFVKNIRGPSHLGVVQRGKEWVNSDDKPQKYFKWKAGEPNGNESFVAMGANGEWVDFGDSELFFVVTWGQR